MLDAYKELTPVVYGENGIKHLHADVLRRSICFVMHWHDRMELLRVIQGQLDLHLGDEHLIVQAGQIAIVAPRMLHAGLSGDSGVIYHTIMFDVEKFYNATSASNKYLQALCKGEIGFVPVTDHPAVLDAADRLIELLTDSKSANPLLAIGTIYEILGSLFQHCSSRSMTASQVSNRFRPILEHINEHYTENISAHSISQYFGYNETYFCRRFKTVTGLTVMKYIQILRMEAAQKMLENTTLDISTIAWKCGYPDVSYFSNCFKKNYGCSPTEFKRRHP